MANIHSVNTFLGRPVQQLVNANIKSNIVAGHTF